MEGLRVCNKCGEELPLTKEFFNWNVSRFRSFCKRCENEESKARYRRNKKIISDKNKKKRVISRKIKREQKEKRINEFLKNGKWKEIRGYENYLISVDGEVFSKHSEKIIAPTIKDNGYIVANLWKNNKGKQRYIHRLVLEHHCDEEQKDTVNHKDGDKSNNHISNLEWMTYTDNNRHAIETGLISAEFRRNNRSSIPVEQLDLNGNLIKVYPSMRQAERETGIEATSIGHGIKKGWKYGGYRWKLHK